MSNNSRFSRILLRGGTREELKIINPMLREREPIVEYDTGRMKIGDGINRYNRLRYVGSSDIVPTIAKFSIIKCYAGNASTTYDWYDGNKIEESLIVTKIKLEYEITSSPDKLIIKYGNNLILNEELPEKLKGTIDIDCNISKNNNKSFKIQLEMLDKNPIEKSTSISFNPYMYYGHGNMETINSIIKELDTSNCSKILISSTKNTVESIQCNNDHIFFFLPKSYYNTGAKFQDADAPLGWGGFKQLDSSGNVVDNSDNPTFDASKTMTLGSTEYYLYISNNTLTSTKNIIIDIK